MLTASNLNTHVRDNLNALSTHAHTGEAGDGAAIYDLDKIRVNTATQKLEYWDSFDGYGIVPGAAAVGSRYVGISTVALGVDATNGRTRLRVTHATGDSTPRGLQVSNNFTPRAAENWTFKAIVSRSQANVGGTITIDVGFRETLSTGIQDGIYFRAVNNANWLLVCRNAGAETTVDMGVAPSSTLILLEFRISSDGASVQGYLNGVLTGAAITTNIPTNMLYVAWLSDKAETITTPAIHELWGWGWKGDLIP